jgi:hypothetical protein
MPLNIETPALLFSANTLILLAYTNRFLTIAQIIRELKKNYIEKENKNTLLEIKNLHLRLSLIRYMQLLGVLSLFLCVLSMTLLFMDEHHYALMMFGAGIVSLLISLALSFWEISISVNALRLHLKDLELD